MTDEEPVQLKGWWSTIIVHVWPNRDLIDHSMHESCTCSPEVEFVTEGTNKRIQVVHRALDGRQT